MAQITPTITKYTEERPLATPAPERRRTRCYQYRAALAAGDQMDIDVPPGAYFIYGTITGTIDWTVQVELVLRVFADAAKTLPLNIGLMERTDTGASDVIAIPDNTAATNYFTAGAHYLWAGNIQSKEIVGVPEGGLRAALTSTGTGTLTVTLYLARMDS